MSEVVAHFNHVFLNRSQVFLHEMLSGFSRVEHWMCCRERVNAELFPYGRIVKGTPFWSKPWLDWLVEWYIYRYRKQLTQFSGSFLEPLQDLQPKLLHAWNGMDGVYGQALCRELNIPLYVSFIGRDMSALPKKARWRFAYQKLFQQVEKVFVLGPVSAERLRELRCPSEKIVIFNLGTNLERFTFKPRHLDTETPILFTACNFVEKKGLLFSLEALGKVKRTGRNFAFRIAGSGPLQSAIEASIQRHELTDCVSLLGPLSNEEVRAEMDNAHIYIQPSIIAADGDTEGTPIVLMEASASGLPVISTFHSDIPSIILHEKSGLLVPEKDVNGLLEAIINLFDNPGKWAVMGQHGRTHIEEHYDIKQQTVELESLYLTN